MELANLTSVFVDSQAWMAIVSVRDQDHGRIVAAYERLIAESRPLVTTTWTYYDAVSHIRERAKNGGYAAAESLKRLVEDGGTVRILRVDLTVEVEALKRFWSFRDKQWSVTTCVNMEAMRSERLVFVLSANRHYVEAGFQPCV